MAQAPQKRQRRGRPQKKENEVTVVGSELISWRIPGQGNSNNFEMMSPDDLLTRRGWRVYREMMADDQIKASIWYKKVLIAARPFDIKPASEDQVDKDAAEFVQKNLEAVNFKRVLMEMLSAFTFGFSAGEILWEIKDAEGGPKLFLKDVKFRDPEWLHIHVDKHGNIKEFVQKPPTPMTGETHIPIPPEKMLHYAYQREFSNHYGVSDLRAAYRAWWSKKYITQFWNVFLERFGAPLMKMTYPQGSSEKLKGDLRTIMNNLSSKTDILVPEGVIIELIEATRSGTAGYAEALTYYDVRIATATLIPALLGMGVDTKRGSDSQSRLHLRTLMKVVQFIGDELAGEVQTKIIQPMVEANFNTDKVPQFMFQDYGEFEAFEITDAIKELFNAGILDMDQEDVNLARSVLGLPIRSEDHEDEIQRPVDPTAAMENANEQAKLGMENDAKMAKQAGGKGGAPQSNGNAKKPVSSKKTDSNGRARPSRRNGN